MILKKLKILNAILLLSLVFYTLTGIGNELDFTKQNIFSITGKEYQIYPLSKLNIRTFYLSDNHPFNDYRLYNSEGNFLTRGFNSFSQIGGNASIFNKLFLLYRLESKNFETIYFQRLNFSYRDKSISLLAGIDSIWLGHGYHGSLLLSSNAHPFRVVKFQTENPFRIPYIGRFSYLLFNGWAEDFKVLGQRFGYFPFQWLEFGLNQTVVYTRNYKFWEFFKILSASQENLPGHYNNDQRASIDVALHLSFLRMISPITNGKIYFEYGGEDIEAWWQKEDKNWVGPLGFEFYDPALTVGSWIDIANTELRIEYSQNYKIFHLFHKVHTGKSYQYYTKKWYRTNPFVNYGSIMGHHMGPEADDLYFELQHQFEILGLKLFFHKERRGLVSGYGTVYGASDYPEIFTQFGGEFRYRWDNLNTSLLIMKNYYKNIDRHPDVLEIISQRGSSAQSFILGLTLSYSFNK